MSLDRGVTQHSYSGLPMDQPTAMVSPPFPWCGDHVGCDLLFFTCVTFILVLLQDLKALLLGSGSNCFTVEWRNQGFTFSDASDLRYGLLQKKVISFVLSL